MADSKVFISSGATKPDLEKSNFDKSFVNHLTARFGRIYPTMVEEAVEGSTYHIKPRIAFDMSPVYFPVQSTVRCHLEVYKLPFRILYDKYEDMVSRQGKGITMPYISRPAGWVRTGSLADYMGLPTGLVQNALGWSSFKVLYRGYRSGIVSDGFELTDMTQLVSSHRPSIDSTHANNFYCILSQSIDKPMDEAESFIRLNSVLDSNSVSGTDIKLLVYAVAATEIQRQVTDDDSGAPFPVFDMIPGSRVYHLDTLAFSSTVASSYSAIAEHALQPTAIEQFSPYSNFNMYNWQLYGHIAKTSAELFNQLMHEHRSLRLLFMWNYQGAAIFGQHLPAMPVCTSEVLFNTATVMGVQKGTLSNGTFTVDAGKFTLRFLGLNSFEYHYRVGLAHDDDACPFSLSVEGQTVKPPRIPIVALPFRAYEFIYNYRFRNERVDPFMINGVEQYNNYLTNKGSGPDSTTPVDFFNCLYEIDPFTSAVKSPQYGDAPLVGITYNSGSATGTLHMIKDGTEADYTVDVSEEGNLLAVSRYSEGANQTTLDRLNELINFGISINDFRNASAFQRFCERYMKVGNHHYKDIVKEFYGTNPPVGSNYPEYLGGVTQVVNIDPIVNSAAGDLPLGVVAGSGYVRGEGHDIEVFCDERSYLMAVMWFSVTPTYPQMLPRLFTKLNYLDYFNPQFNNIGPQPLYKRDIAPLQLPRDQYGNLDPDHINDVFGYQRPWVDYVCRQNEVHGDFRDSLYNYLIQRVFADAPELGRDFISVDDRDLNDVFSYQLSSDKFRGAVYFDISCHSPVARFAIPRIVG